MSAALPVVVVMGVSGCGKSSVGRALAEALGCPFYDGDDFMPPENIAKMASGVPLNDDDRRPWLARLHGLIGERLASGGGAVIACSALRRRYRDQLRGELAGVRFVYLEGNFELIRSRMEARSGHYMKAEMLRSQFEALEPPGPDEALPVSIEPPVEEIAAAILDGLG